MYDIHCHILPGIDDGARFMEESVDMALGASGEATKGIICTPHVFSDSPYEAREVLTRLCSLRQAAEEAGIPVELYAGQEILLGENYREVPQMLLSGGLLTLADSGYVLIEFTPHEEYELIEQKTAFLASRGFAPVIAHPERYRMAQEPENLLRLKKTGALLQLNKGSLKGRFGRAAQEAAHFLLENRAADFLASDAHSPYVRTPLMRETGETVAAMYSVGYARLLLEENPLRVLKNLRIAPR